MRRFLDALLIILGAIVSIFWILPKAIILHLLGRKKDTHFKGYHED